MCDKKDIPTPEEFDSMLKSIGFVESTHTYKNYYIERNIEKKRIKKIRTITNNKKAA